MTPPDGTMASDPTPSVNVTTSGRGGGITYREDGREIGFDWEFAMSPAVALVWGPKRSEWASQYPWAVDRQAAIYDFVGAEVVRQRAADGAFEYDLDLGHLTILNSSSPPARARRAEAAAAAAAALQQHTSVDARLAAAETLQRDDPSTFEGVLAREIRRLSRAEDGLERALRLAAAHPTDTVRQALLWASYNATVCAPRCAALLLAMTGAATEPFDTNVQSMLGKLGKHTSDVDRDAAFANLSTRVHMVLDPGAQD